MFSSSFIIENKFLSTGDFDRLFDLSDVVMLPYSLSSASGIFSQALAESKICITTPLESFMIHSQRTDSVLISTLEGFIPLLQRLESNFAEYQQLAVDYSLTYRQEHSWSAIAKLHLLRYQSLFSYVL